ncbi:MAG: ANTAR domain-containing protein [Oscillospiraceae bacterium]|nr:ANTAR domain-containing protein [Oscillospiraceae bacterium]
MIDKLNNRKGDTIKTLIIAAAEDMRKQLSEMAEQADLRNLILSDGVNAREQAAKSGFDVAILMLPLEKEFGLKLADEIRKTTGAQTMLFVPSKNYDEVCHRLRDKYFFILPKNISRNVAVSAMQTAGAYSERLSALESGNDTLRKMLSEIKLVNRAKCVLIEYLRISEKEAHRQIQKRAMDQRITLTEVAMDILKTYEYLNIDQKD